MFLSKLLKVAAGVGDSINLMKGVREERDARRTPFHLRVQLSRSPRASRNWVASFQAIRSPLETGRLPSICTDLITA